MKYYEVKQESNSVLMNNGWWLVGKELLTEKEIQRRKFDLSEVKKHSDFVEYNKNATYFQFGARFKNTFDARPLKAKR